MTEELFAEDKADRDPEFAGDDADPQETLRETLAEVLEEFAMLDPARRLWHAPGLVDEGTMERWRRVAGLQDAGDEQP